MGKMINRESYIDLLNIISIFAVIILHCSQVVFKNKLDAIWILSSILQSLFIWAVPVFLMISGSNLLSYHDRYDTKQFIMKRMSRVAIPLVFWSIIWYLYNNRHALVDIDIKNFIQLFLTNNIQNIFWFFYVIIGLYMITPILTFLTKPDYIKIGKYIIYANFLFVGVFEFIIPQLVKITLPGEIYNIPIISNMYLALYIFGWYAAQGKFSLKAEKYIKIFGILFGVISAIAIPVVALWNGNNIKYFNSYTGFPVVLFSMAIFITVKNQFHKHVISDKLKTLLAFLAKYSLGIYVVHYFIIYFFENHLHVADSSLFHLLVLPIVTYFISLMSVFVMKKIPLLQKLVP